MLRTCTKCGVTKGDDEFYSVTERGITRTRRICKECCKAQLRDHSNDPRPEGRTCAQCGIYKPLAQFHKHKICLYGVESTCKACRLDKRREYSRKYPDRVRNMDLKAKYGITVADYDAMYARQGGKCAICDTFKEKGKLVVDHNHQTGKVRELLCHLCNAMIGCARENTAILVAAAAYLYREQHPELGAAQVIIRFG